MASGKARDGLWQRSDDPAAWLREFGDLCVECLKRPFVGTARTVTPPNAETAGGIEAFSKRIEKIGATYEMRRYAVTHEIEPPRVGLVGTVRGLRTSPGCLCLMASNPRRRIGEQNLPFRPRCN